MSVTTETLPPAAWLTALLDPVVALRFASYGYATQPPAWGHTARRVPEHLVYLVINESLSANIGGRSWLLAPGGFCLLPPGMLHTFAHADRKRPVSLHFFRRPGPRHVGLRGSRLRCAWRPRPPRGAGSSVLRNAASCMS